MQLGRGSIERDARRLAALVSVIWHLMDEGGYFGRPNGPGVEMREIPDYESDGSPTLDAGGLQQVRYGLFVRGATGLDGMVLLSGTAANPNQPALLLLGSAPTSAAAAGTAGELRADASYLYYCTATDTWKRAELSTW